MKADKKLFVALAAGLAVAGVVGYLMTSEKGKKMAGKWKNRGAELADELEDMVSDARRKFAGLKEEILSGCKQEQQPGEHYQQ